MRLIAIAMLFPLSACVTYSQAQTTEPERRPIGADAMCDAKAVQSHLGHQANQEMGEAILKGSGAASLRWGAPDSAWTMDYRQDRVNVRYDQAMKITAITCG